MTTTALDNAYRQLMRERLHTPEPVLTPDEQARDAIRRIVHLINAELTNPTPADHAKD